jgi:hypothetical protein
MLARRARPRPECQNDEGYPVNDLVDHMLDDSVDDSVEDSVEDSSTK